jgi:hypothetical protein
MKSYGDPPMKYVARLTAVLVLASLALPSPAVANNNLNSSRSNIYRLASSTTLINSKQATAILEALDKTPGMDEAAIKQALPQLLKKNGVDPAKVKDTVVRRDKGGKSFSIILTDKPEDLRAAIAMTDAPPSKTQPKNEKQ